MAKIHALHQLSAALLAAGLLTTAAPTLAQTKGEIVVEAPQVVHERLGRNSNGSWDELVSLDHRVPYTDLDLTKTADAATLQARVKDAAVQGCDQLKKLYPLATHDPDCVKNAMKKAMVQVRAAIGVH
jgi:UrcA family protein